jgi:hypothetical protein
VFRQINADLYHYAANNPVRYIDPDGREEIPLFVERYSEYDNVPRVEKVDTGNACADYLIAGCASWWNLFAGCQAVLTSGFRAGGDLIDYGIDLLDEYIEWTPITGQGVKQDLLAIQTVMAANPQLFVSLISSISECTTYFKGIYIEREKMKCISSLISKGKISDNNIIYKLDDKTQLIFRKDCDKYAHEIKPKYPKKINHYNIEIQKYSEKHHQLKKWRDYHIIVDQNNDVIDYFEQ